MRLKFVAYFMKCPYSDYVYMHPFIGLVKKCLLFVQMQSFFHHGHHDFVGFRPPLAFAGADLPGETIVSSAAWSLVYWENTVFIHCSETTENFIRITAQQRQTFSFSYHSLRKYYFINTSIIS